MSTKSYIGIKQADGSVKYTYCQFDGYPEHMRIWLWAHKIEDIASVINQGRDFRYIEEVFELYEHSGRGAYQKSLEDFSKYSCAVDYFYLYDDGWLWRCCRDQEWTKLIKGDKPSRTSTLN